MGADAADAAGALVVPHLLFLRLFFLGAGTASDEDDLRVYIYIYIYIYIYEEIVLEYTGLHAICFTIKLV